jgi:23S rRNA (cytidine1920-2'-O)/16S rRNA (cytidine1409-2'-O)-methyltransferase
VTTSRMVSPADSVSVRERPGRFVGRGGEKLDAALDYFGINVSGHRALDAGASTGGFTDCLLQRGAASVVAVDVGRGQLHDRLRRHPAVVSRERTHIRDLRLADIGDAPVTVVVADLSFISLRGLASTLVGEIAANGAAVVVLVKPQFEVARADVSRGRGVIRDPALWREAIIGVMSALQASGAAIMGAMVSPLRGADGNVEFFLSALAHTTDGPPLDIDAVIADAAGPGITDGRP